MKPRLYDKDRSLKHYDFVDFQNGYKKDAQWCRYEFETFVMTNQLQATYSTGLRINIQNELVFVLFFGEVVAVRNFTTKKHICNAHIFKH